MSQSHQECTNAAIDCHRVVTHCHTLWLHAAQAPGAPPRRPPLRGRPAPRGLLTMCIMWCGVTRPTTGSTPVMQVLPRGCADPPPRGPSGGTRPSWARPGRPAPRASGRCSCHNSSPPRLSVGLGPGAGAAAVPLPLRCPALRSALQWRSRRGCRSRVLVMSSGCRGAIDGRKVVRRPFAGGQKVM